eukprot:2620555-Prymnesium_polylepis.1
MARRYGVFNKMSIYHAIVLERLLPDDGTEYEALRGRLHVGVTRAPWTSELITEWGSNRELRDILHCSMHIPFYMNHTVKLPDGTRGIDGGFTANLASIGELPTCTVCVFSAAATIHPAVPYGLLRDCFAPMSKARRDDAVAGGLRDALTADLTRLQPPQAGMSGGTPAALMPGPASARASLQYL